MAEVITPNRTDMLLGVINETPPEELTSSYLLETMKGYEAFSKFTRRAVIESLAHLETNGRVAFDPKLHITDIGSQRLHDVGLI